MNQSLSDRAPDILSETSWRNNIHSFKFLYARFQADILEEFLILRNFPLQNPISSRTQRGCTTNCLSFRFSHSPVQHLPRRPHDGLALRRGGLLEGVGVWHGHVGAGAADDWGVEAVEVRALHHGCRNFSAHAVLRPAACNWHLLVTALVRS